MKIEVITTGNEILSARTIDTNFQEIVTALHPLGVTVQYHSSYRDDPDDLADGLRMALRRSDIVILTGGLGPTTDDLTRETASEVFHKRLVLHPRVLAHIRKRLKKYGYRFLEPSTKQATFPEGSEVIPNPVGSAPGFYVEQEGRHFFALPGVPREMHAMLHPWVAPRIARITKGEMKHATRYFRTFGLPELEVERKVRPVLNREGVPYGLTVGSGTVTLSVTVSGPALPKLNARLNRIGQRVTRLLGPAYLGGGDASLEQVVAKILMRSGTTLAVAESCTGGLIGHKLTSVPGISRVLLEDVVCYSNESKMRRLGVGRSLLQRHGAVSAQTAWAMAVGAAETNGADLGLSVTGIAGPTGGTAKTPVGLVYMGLYYKDSCSVYKFAFSGDRSLIRERAANAALNLVRLEWM